MSICELNRHKVASPISVLLITPISNRPLQSVQQIADWECGALLQESDAFANHERVHDQSVGIRILASDLYQTNVLRYGP